MDFREAVIYLLNEAGYRYEDKSFKDDTSRKNHERRKEDKIKNKKEKVALVLPEPNDEQLMLYAYIQQRSAFYKEVVDWFVKKKSWFMKHADIITWFLLAGIPLVQHGLPVWGERWIIMENLLKGS